jgi:hypothetical protein
LLSSGTPTYWSTDGNKIPDLLDFFLTNGISLIYSDLQLSNDLTSDHSAITATLSTPRLHNSKTNWDIYRQIVQDKVSLSIKLKEHENIETETNNLFSLLHHAAKEATPNSEPRRTKNDIPYEIKRLVADKRRARSI